jgi:preprotein translocase subunit SecG
MKLMRVVQVLAGIFVLTMLWLSVVYPYLKNEECKEHGGTLYQQYGKGLRGLVCIMKEKNT